MHVSVALQDEKEEAEQRAVEEEKERKRKAKQVRSAVDTDADILCLSRSPAGTLTPTSPAPRVPRASQDKVDAQKAAGTYMTKAEKEKARIKQVRGWPAWIRVWRVEGPSFPGTPNLSLILLGAWLAHLDMARVEMARLDMARLDIALLSLVLPRI